MCTDIFAGKRKRRTPLEAPWRNAKTERAGKDSNEDHCKMTQDGPEAQTWADFEEDCDAVHQARASKINDSGYSLPVFFRQKLSKDGRCHLRKCRPGVQQTKSKGSDKGTVDDNETLCPSSKLGLGPQTPLETSLAPCSETLPRWITYKTTPLVLATWNECSQEKCFLAPKLCHQEHVGSSLDCLPHSVVKSFDWKREMMRSLQMFCCLKSHQKWAVISLKVGSQSRLMHDKYGNARR